MAKDKKKSSFDLGSVSTALLKSLSINLGYGASANRTDLLAMLKQTADINARLHGLVDSLSSDTKAFYLANAMVKKTCVTELRLPNKRLDRSEAIHELERVGLARQVKSRGADDEPVFYEFVHPPHDYPDPDLPHEPDTTQNIKKFMMDIVRLLQMVRQKAPKVLTDGSPGIRFLGKLAGVIDGSGKDGKEAAANQKYYQLLYWLTLETHLTYLEGKDLRVSDRADTFFQLPVHARIQELFEAWLRLGGLNELTFSDALIVKGSATPGIFDVPDLQRIKNARRLITENISVFGRNERWYKISDLSSYSRTKTPDILIKATPDDEAGRLKLAYRGIFSSEGTDLHDGIPRAANWHRVEGELITAFLWVLSVIGVVNMDGDNCWFCLTQSGRYCLGLSPEPEKDPEKTACLIVQPNFEVVVYQKNASPEILHLLGTFADLVSDQESLVYSISLESTYRASEAGFSLEDLMKFLTLNSTQPIPENVTATLSEWWERCNLVFYTPEADILELADDAASGTPLPAGSVVSGRYVVLQPGSRINSEGVEIDYREDRICATIKNDGTIKIDWRNCSIMVMSRLEAFCDKINTRGVNSQLRINLDMIGEGKVNPDDVITLLNKIASEIPSKIALKLVAAKGGVPPAKVFDVVAVSMPDIACKLKLDESVLASSSYGRLDNCWLVYAAKWEEVKGKLSELGIAIEKDTAPKTHVEHVKVETLAKPQPAKQRSQSPEELLKLLNKAIERKCNVELVYIVKDGRKTFCITPVEILSEATAPVVEALDMNTGNNMLLTVENIELINRIFRKSTKP